MGAGGLELKAGFRSPGGSGPGRGGPEVRSLTVDPKTRNRIVSGTLVLLLVVVLISSLAGR